MKTLFRRSAAFLMTVILCAGLLISVQAQEVNYVYAGKYIKNWGVRDVVCTFLSPNAEAFYEKNGITIDELMLLSGSSDVSSVPSSELYKQLKSLMVTNHKHQTSYQETRDLYQYTDCQNSGLTGNKISSFYSGKEIGPAWDSGSTWNREHVWPNSKGDLSGNGENDIMMLRPTAKSENGSRGNSAYGTTSSYYNPNEESGGKYDLRGDVCRIILYQYVRWGCINTGSKYNSKDIFGTAGVIESKAVLLKWMEEDPVDTWELGRNDSVETITGTRNVFVDYPELGFALFNEQVPDEYQTPSGSALDDGFTITAKANNKSYGSITVSGNIITATPAEGYIISGYTVTDGNAKVIRKENTFTVKADSDVTIEILFEKAPLVTLRFSENGSEANAESCYKGQKITLPSHSGNIFNGYLFVGWSEQDVSEGDAAPQYYKAGSNYTVKENITLKALYAYQKDHGPTLYFTTYDNGCNHSEAYSKEKVEPTCTELGRESGEFCPACNAFISGGEAIDAIGHTYSNKCDTVCDICNEDNGIKIEHDFNDEGICKECGAKQSETSDGESNISESVSSESPDESYQDESDKGESVDTSIEDSVVTSEAAPDDKDAGFKWWIITVIAGGILIVLIAVTVVEAKKQKKSKYYR